MNLSKRVTSSQALELLRDQRNTAELLVNAEKRRRHLHGNRAYYGHSLNINPTNLCENKCELCAFWRKPDAHDAYRIDLGQAREKLMESRNMQLTDLHIVGGLDSALDLDYYEKLLRMCREVLPDALIQGLTAVEIDYLARQQELPVSEVLIRLKAAGLGAIPGGGAEIFDEAIRRRICSNKIGADRWLSVHEQAHKLGIPTNATMLFGHLEQPEHIIDHLQRLRKLQDRTNGFQAFIALPFHTKGTKLEIERGPSGHVIARTVALSRMFLDNISHMRLLVNYLDRKLLQVLVRCVVDDIGGTSLDERIAKAAGGSNSCCFYSIDEMDGFLTQLDLEPVLVNSIYESPEKENAESAGEPEKVVIDGLASLTAKVADNARVSAEEAVMLHDKCSFAELGRLANLRRFKILPDNRATVIMDRNISLTNICVSACEFCAFYVDPDSPKAFTLSIEQVLEKVGEAVDHGATQILIQGGLNPALPLTYYESIFRAIKERYDVWIHSLTATEIDFLAKQAKISVEDTLKRLIAAGLDSLPGGGAEILVDEVRSRISPRKINTDQWFEVMRTAHRRGLKSTATMVYGFGETTAQRVEHLMRIRELQDQTGGFTAFIPWSFQPEKTRIKIEKSTGVDYLRVLSLARVVLDNVPHIQGGWVTEGPDLDQLALSFGADDFGGILMEEQVVRATGVSYWLNFDMAVALINDAGLTAVQRTTQYDDIRELRVKNGS